MKKKLLTSFLISILLTIGFMGIFGTTLMSHDNQGSCFFVVSGMDCTIMDDSLFMEFYHLSGVDYLTQFIFNQDFSFLFLLTISFILVIGFIKHTQNNSLVKLVFQKISKIKVKLREKKQILHWLSLINNTDSSTLKRVHCIT